MAICVKRDRLLNGTKGGVCSNYLCDLRVGDKAQITGPMGTMMLLPTPVQSKPLDMIGVATGTGIAPFRAFAQVLFGSPSVAADRSFDRARMSLYFGTSTRGTVLYQEEWEKLQRKFRERFDFHYTLSREPPPSPDAGYIQQRLEHSAESIIQRLLRGAHIYFCGKKAMMPDMMAMFQRQYDNMYSDGRLAAAAARQLGLESAGEKGSERAELLPWKLQYGAWVRARQWHVEVY